MCILSDRDIIAAIRDKKITIEPFSEDSLTPNGYDLCVSEILVRKRVVKAAKIGAMEWFAVSTVEYIALPQDACAQLWLRSSWARLGVIGAFGKVDAGFKGTLTLPAFNASPRTIEIKENDKFVQIVFENMCSKALKDYEKRSGAYQGQRGIRLC